MDEDRGSRGSSPGRRLAPLRSVGRGLKAACRWTIGLGRGRSASAGQPRRGRRARRAPMASISAAMLEPNDEMMELGDDTSYAPSTSNQPPAHLLSALHVLSPSTDGASSGAHFPLAIRPPAHAGDDASPELYHHRHPRSLQYHIHADHHHNTHNGHRNHTTDDADWSHHHPHHAHACCTCGGVSAGKDCSSLCALTTSPQHNHSSEQQQQQPGSHSLQHLLAVGSRQWGGGGWWDGRALLRVKIYDFAVYADPVKAHHALRSAVNGGARLLTRAPSSSSSSNPPTSTSLSSLSTSPAGLSPTDLLVSPASGVGLTLTIRACRNLPLPLLSSEFERILQRRHEKAGGRADDPALAELLSYFSRERLPPHVVTPLSAEAAVKKGAAITFSRSSAGELVTEAGGSVLGRVHSPALAEALFDLYLGDQPVSKKAKAAAGAALLQLAGDMGSDAAAGGRFRYRPQSGERLLCAPGASADSNPSACVLEAA